MTMLVAVSGGCNVLVLAFNTAEQGTARDFETGAERPDVRPYPPAPFALSARHPIAAGTFGIFECPGGSVPAAMARCRARFDGEGLEALPAAYTVREVAERLALELFHTFGETLKEIGHRWSLPPFQPDVGHPCGSFVGGLVAGYPGAGGPPECWFILVTAAGVAQIERKFQGGPDRWGLAITPGADAAGAAIRQVIREVPRTLSQAAAMARDLIQAQIAAGEGPFGVAVGGPIQLLGLAPGAPPVCLDPVGAAA